MNIEGAEQPVLAPHAPHGVGRFDRIAGAIALALGIAIIMAIATVPLSARQQAAFGIASALIFVFANRFKSRRVTLFLVALSLAVSARYLFWRMTETLNFESPLGYMLGSGLVLAEIYAVLTLVLGYFQTVWPLERKPVPLPADSSTWPTVDLYIPTYNEELSIVRASVLGALAIDWPKDKLNIFILDDGRRDQFRQFAELTGVGYITRSDNNHAKAGNLNHAMTKTNAEFVAIFDCDHIPTRAFLQMTMGFLVADPNLAMVQTPQGCSTLAT